VLPGTIAFSFSDPVFDLRPASLCLALFLLCLWVFIRLREKGSPETISMNLLDINTFK
jgi:flagellar biogenesis protein FliO